MANGHDLMFPFALESPGQKINNVLQTSFCSIPGASTIHPSQGMIIGRLVAETEGCTCCQTFGGAWAARGVVFVIIVFGLSESGKPPIPEDPELDPEPELAPPPELVREGELELELALAAAALTTASAFFAMEGGRVWGPLQEILDVSDCGVGCGACGVCDVCGASSSV